MITDLMIASFVGLIACPRYHIYIIKNDMVVDMSFVNVSREDKFVLIFKYSVAKFQTNLVSHFRRSFTRQERLNKMSCKYSRLFASSLRLKNCV